MPFVMDRADADDAPEKEIDTQAPERAANAEGSEGAPETAAPLDIPGRWTDEEKAQIAKLDPQVRGLIFGRYKETLADQTRRAQEAAELRKRYTPIEEIIAPRRQQFQMNGLDEARALQQLFALSDYASNDPAGFVRMFVQQRGLRPEELFQLQQAPQPEHGGYVDPQIQALQAKIAQLEAATAQGQQYFASERQRQEAARFQGAMSEVEKFKAAKAQDGKPAHPHYDAVSGAMAKLLQVDPDLDLQSAYEQACWATPSIREAMLAEKQRADALAAKDKAARARNAGASVTNAASGEPARAKSGGSLREDIKAALAEQRARA